MLQAFVPGQQVNAMLITLTPADVQGLRWRQAIPVSGGGAFADLLLLFEADALVATWETLDLPVQGLVLTAGFLATLETLPPTRLLMHEAPAGLGARATQVWFSFGIGDGDAKAALRVLRAQLQPSVVHSLAVLRPARQHLSRAQIFGRWALAAAVAGSGLTAVVWPWIEGSEHPGKVLAVGVVALLLGAYFLWDAWVQTRTPVETARER